jgi:hypothetical protein
MQLASFWADKWRVATPSSSVRTASTALNWAFGGAEGIRTPDLLIAKASPARTGAAPPRASHAATSVFHGSGVRRGCAIPPGQERATDPITSPLLDGGWGQGWPEAIAQRRSAPLMPAGVVQTIRDRVGGSAVSGVVDRDDRLPLHSRLSQIRDGRLLHAWTEVPGPGCVRTARQRRPQRGVPARRAEGALEPVRQVVTDRHQFWPRPVTRVMDRRRRNRPSARICR